MGILFLFHDRDVIKRNRKIICSGTLEGNLYTLKPKTPTMQKEINSSSSKSNKRKEPSKMNQTYLWHLRLGHINLSRFQMLIADGPLGSLVVEYFST